ncbi:Na+ dependent nucleoside transporter NupC [hydrothermal vent metagenome]|uniref:Na+ dependent nucleoside transporter NupC n=1 Tax=hydrothermal vent metagenome TaxID=652676 RepID=A0A3B0RYM2_9ZZZZ
MLISILGMAVLLGLAVILSSDRKAINIRVVGAAFVLQVAIAVFVLATPFGQGVLQSISNGAQVVINYADTGSAFVFGGLHDNTSIGFIFAVKVLPIIIFISALTSVLYYLGIMQWVVKILGGLLRMVIGTSQVESLNAAGNIFLGQTESPLLVKPYLGKLSEHQLFTIMVSGLASVSGAILVGYASLGVELKYLIAASFMAAPGGLLMAKIIMPDPDKDTAKHAAEPEEVDKDDLPANVVDAAASGATQGLLLAANIGAMLIAFVALIGLLNGGIGGIGQLIGQDGWSLDAVLGWVFRPLMWTLGVPWDEAAQAGNLIGQKLILNEFVAYANLKPLLDTLSPHTVVVVTFALCGFANLSSMAILLGGLGGLIPSRRKDIARLGIKAVAAGSLSNLMSAALASLLVVVV